jgi:glycosyltransferase involved in cell wall biosynthesis
VAVIDLEAQAWRGHDAYAWRQLAASYAGRGWLPEAKAAYRRALGICPDDRAALAELTDLLLTQGLPYSAQQVLRQAAATGVEESLWKPRLAELEARWPVRRVTLVAPAYRCEATLGRCLRAMEAQTYPVHERFVVDDHSPDRSAEIARGLGVRVVAHPENRGLAAACNTALQHCTDEFLVKLDSDIEPSPVWLERAMLAFTDPAVAGVGGRVTEHYTATVPDQWRRVFMQQHWGPERLDEPPGLFGADCVFRVEALQQVGGWNTRYRNNFEDMDLSRRLKAVGYRLIYEPLAWARHLRRDRLPDVLNNFWNWYHPTTQDQGGYDSLAHAAVVIGHNRTLVQQRLAQALGTGAAELTYPSFLLFYWLCLSDLKHLLRRDRAEMRAVLQTMLGVFLFARHELRRTAALPPAVVERALNDLKAHTRTHLAMVELGLEGDPAAFEQLSADAVVGALPAADANYLHAFAAAQFARPLQPAHGVLLGVSVAALAAGEREARDGPRVVWFNPPVRRDTPPASEEDAAARWLTPSRIEASAERLRARGVRVQVLDAVARQLDDLEGHERLLGLEPAVVVYSLAEGGLDRVTESARRLKLLVPDCPRLVLAHAEGAIAPGDADRYPMFDAVSAGEPDVV